MGKDQKPLAEIHWRVITTGAEGHGEPIDAEEAQANVEQLNKQHPDMQHWVVPVAKNRDRDGSR